MEKNVYASKQNLNLVLFYVVSHLLLFSFILFEVTKGPFLLEFIDGRCSYRETWLISMLTGVLLARNPTFTLFICSLKLGVDTEKLRFQKAALNTLWLLDLEIPFDLIISVFGLRHQSVLQKSFGLPLHECHWLL